VTRGMRCVLGRLAYPSVGHALQYPDNAVRFSAYRPGSLRWESHPVQLLRSACAVATKRPNTIRRQRGRVRSCRSCGC
jgi:hypothetical protein